VFNVGKSPSNPAGEPLYAAAMRLRLEIEAQMCARGGGKDGTALQAVGLLLQLEGLDRDWRDQRAVHSVEALPAGRRLAAP
jgi:hypothetical protein